MNFVTRKLECSAVCTRPHTPFPQHATQFLASESCTPLQYLEVLFVLSLPTLQFQDTPPDSVLPASPDPAEKALPSDPSFVEGFLTVPGLGSELPVSGMLQVLRHALLRLLCIGTER